MVNIAVVFIAVLSICAFSLGGLPVYDPDTSRFIATHCKIKIRVTDLEGFDYQQMFDHVTAYIKYRSQISNLPKDFTHKFTVGLHVLLRIKLTDLGDNNPGLKIPERKGNVTVVDCKLKRNNVDNYLSQPVDKFVYKESQTEYEDGKHVLPLAELVGLVAEIGNVPAVKEILQDYLAGKIGRVLTSCIVFDGEYEEIALGTYLLFGCVIDLSNSNDLSSTSAD